MGKRCQFSEQVKIHRCNKPTRDEAEEEAPRILTPLVAPHKLSERCEA